MPTLTVVAGPNGSGKSTLTRSVEIEGRERLLDPDAIAKTLNLSPVAAGREALRLQAEYFRAGLSFAVETTLAGNRGQLIEEAKSHGYTVHLIYVALPSPEHSVHRIQNRVWLGGHFVPDADVRRRYARSLANAERLILEVDIARVYDNSGVGHRLVLIAEAGRVIWRAPDPPAWMAHWGC